jgi:hypothetical protein
VDPLDWLLDSDPAIRWQTMRDLTGSSREAIAAERRRVPREGVGAEILARQGSDGCWHRADAPVWLPTLFTMLLLRATGVDPAEPAIKSAIARLEAGFRWDEAFGKKPFFEGEVEPCINGGALALGAYFGRPMEGLARRLAGEQLDDGGWNCEAPKSKRSSFHTTICVLEGLLEYERAAGDPAGTVAAARRRGQEYLLVRQLSRRLSTGEVADPDWLRFSFPTWWHYDVLWALDYFRNVGDAPDPRLAEAIALLRSKQQPDGTWLLEHTHRGAVHFSMEDGDGQPSRWNTLRALRVLNWHNG